MQNIFSEVLKDILNVCGSNSEIAAYFRQEVSWYLYTNLLGRWTEERGSKYWFSQSSTLTLLIVTYGVIYMAATMRILFDYSMEFASSILFAAAAVPCMLRVTRMSN